MVLDLFICINTCSCKSTGKGDVFCWFRVHTQKITSWICLSLPRWILPRWAQGFGTLAKSHASLALLSRHKQQKCAGLPRQLPASRAWMAMATCFSPFQNKLPSPWLTLLLFSQYSCNKRFGTTDEAGKTQHPCHSQALLKSLFLPFLCLSLPV